MSKFKFAPDLFLEVAEMDRFQKFMDEDGFRKNILDNSINFGLIKLAADTAFENGHVERDVDNSLGQKTIKIGALVAIDSNGLFIVSNSINNFPVPSDNNWYWVKIKHLYSSQEEGSVSIDIAGNLTGVNTKFTEVLRGNPNFPSRVKFINSSGNTLEYDVLDVTDNTHAVLVHPAVTVGGEAEFVAETNLYYQIVGTFQFGAAISNDDKFPFQYDSCQLELVLETSLNIPPSFTIGQEFYLARVKVSNGVLVIQDKRLSYWETKGSDQAIRIERDSNPLIGIEAIKWQNGFNTGDKNIVQVAWGMRSLNWSVDSSQNILTLFGSSLGGEFKTIDDFTDGDFDEWRVYTSNGNYRNIVSSVKQGSAINLVLDVLDVDDYSNDGGLTFIEQEVVVVPNCEEIEFKFTADPTDEVENVNETLIFPVNRGIGECLITVYKDPICLYNVQYRYKSFKEYTGWQPIISGSYLMEISYDDNGALRVVEDRETFDYISDPVAGFIQLTISPNSYSKFANKVFKGDIIGVNTITAFTPSQVLELKVGRDKRYQYITGNISLSDDLYISLSADGAVEGNEFRLHFDCDTLNLGEKVIYVADNYSNGVLNAIKTMTQGDFYEMKNRIGGIVLDCVFDNNGHWQVYQNYDLGQPFETTMFDGDLTACFDPVSGEGKVIGWYGWKVHTIMSGRTPLAVGQLTDIEGNTMTFGIGDTGGVFKHKLTKNEMPKHRANLFSDKPGQTGNAGSNKFLQSNAGLGGNSSYNLQNNANQVDEPNVGVSSLMGNDESHTNMQPWYGIAFVKKQY